MAKKKRNPKVHFTEDNNSSDAKKILPEVKAVSPELNQPDQPDHQPDQPDHQPDQLDAEPQIQVSDSVQATVTSSESTKKRLGGARGVAALHKVVVKKAKGKKCKIRYNELGVPIGANRPTLQSYIGMAARNMIPIDIPSWPDVDSELKAKLWLDVQDTFNITPELEDKVLKSAGSKWRQFKSNLTTKHVVPYIGQKKHLKNPPRQYAFVSIEVWRRFVAERTSKNWKEIHTKQAGIVSRRKYHHRMSRKGYIGLQEEEIKAGKLKRGELPDRAILWKKARMPKDASHIDEELVKINAKIDDLLEKKGKGEFIPSGSNDVLTEALGPEHSGRVRGVGGFVTPKLFFNLPRQKRSKISKEDLCDELERQKKEIAELKAMIISASNLGSPMSDKSSCQPLQEDSKAKPEISKELMVDNEKELMVDDECFAVDPPLPTEKKGPCDLAVDTIENKVAFGCVFDEAEMTSLLHGRPLPPGCVRVSVDGVFQGNALVPVPVPGEIEKVHQAVGCHLAWPVDLIIFPNVGNVGVPKKKKEVLPAKSKNEFKRMQSLFNNVQLNENVPSKYKLLYKHALTFMKATGASIQIPCEADVFGIVKTIFILDESLIALLQFDMIGQAAISAYMAYLHTLIHKDRKNDDVVLYGFFDPGSTFTLNSDFETYVVNRLKESNYYRIYFMPHNHNAHWILLILWDGDIFILDPLPHHTRFTELEDAMTNALRSYNAKTGRAKKPPKITYLAGSPKQPGGTECGYVVMRYMRDIVMDKEMSFTKKWAAKNRKSVYTMEELDMARLEAIEFIQDKM